MSLPSRTTCTLKGDALTTQIVTTQLQYTKASTLGEMLVERANGPQGADIRLLFVRENEIPEGRHLEGEDDCLTFSYRETYDTACRAAQHLKSRGVEAGDRVLIVLPTGPSFMATYHGCQLLGAICVPVVPPLSLARLDDHIARIARIARICEAKATVVDAQLLPVLRVARGRHKDARQALSNLILGTDVLAEEEALLELTPRSADDVAMIQFTSGSTGDPKGVVLPHSSLLANMKGIGLGAEFRAGDVAVSWLPLFHDMGLIGHFLASMAWGLPLVLIPPEKFIRRPKEWLKAMSKYKGTASAAPNFAYSLCAKKIKDRDLEGVDLSSWRVAFCGAEPINAETVFKFIDRFKPYNFASSTFFPVYGMAEFSLAATFPPAGREPLFDTIDRRLFESTGEARPREKTNDEADTIVWISVGVALPGGHSVRVVDSNGEPLPERREGDVEVRGPSLMSGYYKSPLATAEAMNDGWLRTGDLGYIADGELYVSGRRKELIIKGGKNLYPQDVEAAAAKVEGIRVGCCAAFGLTNAKRGTEDMILICETRITDADERARMVSAIRGAVLEATSATPDVVLLVDPGVVPKTSSGKIQRDLMRKRYKTGDLRRGRPSIVTLARLKLHQTVERIRTLATPSLRRKK